MADRKKSTQHRFTAHYISGTHWDREWYRPFQEFRMLLVELVDGLLDLMEKNPDFTFFHLDGQTCVLKDYLEIRPEQKEKIAGFIKEGRILIGPWYTMPDLFCPSEEALIRNLLLGRKICHEWGVEPMPVAYTCDMFGHPGQMPQIYRGFGLKGCVLGRGANEHTTPAFFLWESPDGEGIFTYKLEDAAGYAAFYSMRNILESPSVKYDPDALNKAKDYLKKYLNGEMKRSNAPVICLIDALDHTLPAKDAPRYLRMVEELFPEIKTVHSTLPAFFDDAKKQAGKVPSRRGELREPSKKRDGYNWLIANCVSARVRMKQANDWCQTLLEKWAEPLTAIANMEGAEITNKYSEIAWQNVVVSHAHDSICGCSIDQVHTDMMYRFDQARIIADQLRTKAFGFLTESCKDLAKEKDEFTVTIANPSPVARNGVLVFELHLPKDYPAVYRDDFGGSQDVCSFTLHDMKGREVPYQRLSVTPNQKERSRFAKHAFIVDADFRRYVVAAQVDLPPLGFTSLLVKPEKLPYRRLDTMRTGPVGAENEYLTIEVASNGTISITDKANGETYSDLMIFEDRSEIGDGWFHNHLVSDEIALSTACPVQVSVVHDGPEVVTFRLAVTMNIPKHCDWRNERRSDERVDIPITNLVSLRRGSRTVDIETIVENNAEDHRLRLLLPTDAVKAKTYFAHQPFDIVERKISLNPETSSWQEPELAEKPFLGMQAVGDGKRGLAFLSSGGLHEGGVADDKRRTMLVTLLRSFRRTAGTTGEPGGLELGEITYRYSIMPFTGKFPVNTILNALSALQGGIFVRQTGQCSSGFPAMTGNNPPSVAYIETKDNNLAVSTIKAPLKGEGIIIRLWNPHDTNKKETIRFWRKPVKAVRMALSEEPCPGIKPRIQGNNIVVEAGPHEIITIAVILK